MRVRSKTTRATTSAYYAMHDRIAERKAKEETEQKRVKEENYYSWLVSGR